MKFDIKVFNESSVSIEFDRTYKYREHYICFENYEGYKPTTDNRVLAWYDEQAKMLITGHAYYRDNENFESYIKVYNVLKKDNKLHKYQIENCQIDKDGTISPDSCECFSITMNNGEKFYCAVDVFLKLGVYTNHEEDF